MALVEWDDSAVVQKLNNVIRRVDNISPLLTAIGFDLVESTKKRFAWKVGPDGEEWERNSDTTVNLVWKDKTGNSRGPKGENNPLIYDGYLYDSIAFNIDGHSLEIGSSMEYAAMQQFGGTKSEFPHLWGDIPKRPFLGISDNDEQMILTTADDFLSGYL